MENKIKETEQYLLHTYNRYPVVFEKGEGTHLYDIEGKEYLDFVSGIAVFALGYGNKEFTQAIQNQMNKLIHTSNYYYSEPLLQASKKLTKAATMDRVFFTNSGAEAIEGAIKTARKYAFLKDGTTDHEIIAMNHSFHGRTMGALSITGNTHYREAFEPLIGPVKFAEYNDIESVKAAITEKTCAIILETVQGEGGIIPAEESFLREIRKICDEKDILMILDEIQCGMGRTGYLFAWQKFGVKPDVMCVAKAIGCGLPVGAFLMTQKVADHSLVAGDHGTTYGGNPLVCVAVEKVLDIFEKDGILNNVREVSVYLEEQLDELVSTCDNMEFRRGSGLMQGIVCKKPVADIINKALDEGLVLINAGQNILRFLPPLIICKQDVDKMIAKLKKCI